MERDAIRTELLAALSEIAPEADLEAVDPCLRLRDQLDLDSMDYLNFMIALHRRLKVEIPEADYGLLASLEDAVSYLQQRL
jgi:acyl carrier protein